MPGSVGSVGSSGSPGVPASLSLLGDRIVIGVLVVSGVSAVTSGPTTSGPTWRPPVVSSASWSPSPSEPVASPPLSGEAIVTGALVVTGASAATLGVTSGEPTCPVPDEPVVS